MRGITILYDQAMAGIMEPVVVAMSSAFAAFPSGRAVAPPPRRKVEYASGVAVGAGQIVTSREALEGCYVVTVARHRRRGSRRRGQGERARAAARARRGPEAGRRSRAAAPKGADVTLLGVADPQAQGGGSAVSTAKARVSDALALEPAPALGFDGAAALDAQGRLAGIAALKRPWSPAPPRPERDRRARAGRGDPRISSMRRMWRPRPAPSTGADAAKGSVSG